MDIESLKNFEIVGSIYENRNLWPSFKDYSEANSDEIDAMIIFVGDYAFEHQGRSPDFAHMAKDVLRESKQQYSLTEAINAGKVWQEFRDKIINLSPGRVSDSDRQKNTRAAANVNPLAPHATEYEFKRKNPVGVVTSRPQKTRDNSLSIIEFMTQLDRKNIVDWTIKRLKNNLTKDAHGALTTINGIGDKIASLWLRDVAYRFDCIPSENEELLFPVDIWVRRVAAALLAGEKEYIEDNDPVIAKLLTRKCIDLGLSPEKINMGIWYMGAQIARSKYMMKKALQDTNLFQRLVRDHLMGMKRAVEFANPAI